MNLLGGLRTQHREQPAEGAVGGRGLGVKACEAAVDQVAAQFAIELTKAPTLQVQQRSRRSGAIPGRPLRAEAGRRPARQSRTRSTNRGSSSPSLPPSESEYESKPLLERSQLM